MTVNAADSQELATAINLYSDTMADNISNNNPLTFTLRKRGNVKPASGGNYIEETLMHAENSTVKWYSGSEVLDTTNQRVIGSAIFPWKQLNGNVTMDGLEEIKNAGESRKYDLYTAKVKVLEISLSNELGSNTGGVFSDGTGTGGKALTGVQAAVPDDPTTGTYGGIDRSLASNGFWRNQVVDMSTDIGAVASASNIKAGMQKLWIRTINKNDKPDIIVMDENYFTFLDNATSDLQRFTKAGEAEISFESYMYKTAKVYYDEACPSNHAYFLNTNYLYLREFPGRRFTVDKEIKVAGQDAKIVPVYWAGNLTCANAQRQGVLKN